MRPPRRHSHLTLQVESELHFTEGLPGAGTRGSALSCHLYSCSKWAPVTHWWLRRQKTWVTLPSLLFCFFRWNSPGLLMCHVPQPHPHPVYCPVGTQQTCSIVTCENGPNSEPANLECTCNSTAADGWLLRSTAGWNGYETSSTRERSAFSLQQRRKQRQCSLSLCHKFQSKEFLT